MPTDDRDETRRPVRITDKRRVRADESDQGSRAEEPLGPPSVARGAPSGDPRGSSEAESESARGSSEETPLVTEEDPSADTGGGDPSAGEGDAAGAASGQAERAEEYLEDLKRLKAEFENYRKRVLKEQTRAVDLAAEPVMAKLLEVLDEFELALMAAERTPDFERFVRGVEMVFAKLTDVLRSEGLERIEAEGKPFDPARHEALLQSEGEGEGEPVVADVLRPGYTLKGRVIRPAGVKVTRR